MYRNSKSINLKKVCIRFTYFMFYLIKVSPIARVTSGWTRETIGASDYRSDPVITEYY